jgi:hypothetical protein
VVVRWATDQNTPSNGFSIDRVDVHGASTPPPVTTVPDAAVPPLDPPPGDDDDGGSAGGCQVGGGGTDGAWLILAGLVLTFGARRWRGPRSR